MKKRMIAAVAIAMMATACSDDKVKEHVAIPAAEVAPISAPLSSEISKVSYAIGLDVANSLKNLGADIDRAAFLEAFNAQLDGAKARLTAEEAAKAKQEFFQKRAAKQAEERKASGEKSKAEGEVFLAENGKKDGIITTDSGLQYEVLKMGDGKKPVATDKVKVHYRGTLLNGTEFDSSYKRGQPISFPLNGVIKGWTEGVQLMPTGSKFKFYIPSELAYGEKGAGTAIPGNATLIFEVELLAIETEKPAEAKPATK
ncbi:MAG: FKBP-type peptidyl-prolyl cis-trans isomerase [Mariprofundaceae bacterium]|nr:FKBP-type peptidyl-prolyl cis-trans isomerase [Mariprofundaceae bacterium]